MVLAMNEGIVSIVACGPSALKCGAARAPGFVIAVNDAYQHVRHDAVLSMDGRWAKHRVRSDFLGPDGPPLFVRESAWLHVPDWELLRQPEAPRVHVFACDHTSAEFAEPPDAGARLNGKNSGYCALNLAYQMRPKTLYLFGFDHSGGHFHPESEWRQRGEGCANTPRKFADWSTDCYIARSYFDDAGVHVINTNRKSIVRAFEFGDAP